MDVIIYEQWIYAIEKQGKNKRNKQVAWEIRSWLTEVGYLLINLFEKKGYTSCQYRKVEDDTFVSWMSTKKDVREGFRVTLDKQNTRRAWQRSERRNQ